MRYAYLLFDVAIATSLLGVTFFRVDYWSYWRQFMKALLCVSLPFLLWDIWATSQGHWAFNSQYTLGVDVFGLPIEEILFFVVVPLACLVVWHALPDGGSISAQNIKALRVCMVGLGLAMFIAIFFMPAHGYTSIVLGLCGITLIMLSRFKSLVRQRRYIIFQVWTLVLFIICNTYLTLLPIVTYGQDFVTGIRVGTIPIEDFMYNFALLNLFLVIYLWAYNNALSNQTHTHKAVR